MSDPKYKKPKEDSFATGFVVGLGLAVLQVLIIVVVADLTWRADVGPSWLHDSSMHVWFVGWYQYLFILPYVFWSKRKGLERQAYGAITFSLMPAAVTTTCGAFLYSFSSGGPY